IDTLYFGGGTPSRLGADGVARLLDLCRRHFAVDPLAEITLEANPDDVTRDVATAWRQAGVTRVSLGAQSFDDDALRWMHRTHDAAAIVRAADALRDAGLPDFSLDLIFALPDDVPRGWEADLERALSLSPAHVSLYGLTVETHTPLGRARDRGTLGD